MLPWCMDKDRSTQHIASIVKDANRTEIAKCTGLSLSGASRILSGDRLPKYRNLVAVARALGVDVAPLLQYLCKLNERRHARIAA